MKEVAGPNWDQTEVTCLLVCRLHVDVATTASGWLLRGELGWGGAGQAYGGAEDRGDEPGEALCKCHGHFDSWTVFKKQRCRPFPPLCRHKEPGRQTGKRGGGEGGWKGARGMFSLNKQLRTMSTFCPA